MSDKTQYVDHAVEAFEQAVGSDFKKFNLLMLECLNLIRSDIPEVGIRAIEEAKKHWHDGVDNSEKLLSERRKCWKYLDDRHGMLLSDSNDYIALRLVICVLYPEPTTIDFVRQSIDFFVENLMRITGEYQAILLILRG